MDKIAKFHIIFNGLQRSQNVDYGNSPPFLLERTRLPVGRTL
jgi:hypothetical protein